MVIVVKGDKEGADKWVVSYKFPFLVYLDSEAGLYKCLGLSRTAWILDIETAYLYATKLVRKEFIPPGHPGDDMLQLAGDFIVDMSGHLVYAYPGKNSSDRPSLSELCDTLEFLNSV